MSQRIPVKSLVVVALCVALVIVGSFFVARASSSELSHSVIEVRWLISHQPVDVFDRATRVFAEELSRESDGEMELVVITPEQVGLSEKGDIPASKVMQLLDNGRVDLASPYTIPLGNSSPAFWSLNLPFLFSDYGHAISVLDGPIGMEMLERLSSQSTVRGLAFTMSGGFRVIASKNTSFTSPADFVGKRIATSGGPVAEATLISLGATPVSLDLESGSPVDLTDIDGVETTYARLSGIVETRTSYTKYISETDHSIFLTALVTSNAFYESLSARHRAALQKAALAAARVERDDAIALNAATKAELSERGSAISTVDPENREVFKRHVQPVYTQFEDVFGRLFLNELTAKK